MCIEWFGKTLHIETVVDGETGKVTHQEVDGVRLPVAPHLYIKLDDVVMPIYGINNSFQIPMSVEDDLLDQGIVEKVKAKLVARELKALSKHLAAITLLSDSVNIDFYNQTIDCNVRGQLVQKNWHIEGLHVSNKLARGKF